MVMLTDDDFAGLQLASTRAIDVLEFADLRHEPSGLVQ
jgi:hypothetical protein